MPAADVQTLSGAPSFKLAKPFNDKLGPRVGYFSFPGRQPIETPHYIAISSRGAVPHLSQDTMRESTSIKGLYAGLEDSLQHDALLVLGPRRLPPVDTPAPNSYTSLSILTSVGFRTLEISDYIEAAQKLRPDIIIGSADIMYGERRAAAGLKRMEKMGERSLAWMKGLTSALEATNMRDDGFTSLWAPILPIEAEMQREYLEYLTEDDVKGGLGGMVLYDRSSLTSIPVELADLPRLALTDPTNPHEILQDICLGADIFAIPFVTSASDAGVALSFTFPATEAEPPKKQSLGVDMWSPQHATDPNALQAGSKEMLGWVLLQIHNHAVIDAFFGGVRASIASGTFGEDVQIFDKVYAAELPIGTGTGPRVRGYHFHRSGLTTKKNNPSTYRKLPDAEHLLDDSAEKLAEDGSLLSPEADAKDLEAIGFTQATE
ncbi:hypothetical protein MMC30_008130 [Trapelia coarctata]|nr:hypothetical protein [Trapelia coarctata]